MKTVIRFVLLKTVKKCPFAVYGLHSHAYKRTEKCWTFSYFGVKMKLKGNLMKSDLMQSNGGFFLRQKKKILCYSNEGKFARSPALSGTEILYTFSFIHSYHMKGTSYEHVYNC